MVVLRCGCDERGAAAGKLLVVDMEIDFSPFDVDRDLVAVLDKGDGATRRGFGLACPTQGPFEAPEKRPSVMSATDLESPMPTMADVGVSISRMPGPPAGPS